METKDLALLEEVFAAETYAAMNKIPLYIMQTEDINRANSLVAKGMLRKVKEKLVKRLSVAGYTLTEPLADSRAVAGYVLTELGRLTCRMYNVAVMGRLQPEKE